MYIYATTYVCDSAYCNNIYIMEKLEREGFLIEQKR